MEERTRTETLSKIFGRGTGSHYDQIVEITTGGKDRLWKEELLSRMREPRRVLDLACGTGILTFAIRERFPEADVVGVEINPEYLSRARKRCAERRDSRVTFVEGAAEDVELAGSFDVVASCYLPKYADLPRLVPSLVERLGPGGLFIMHDFTYPSDPVVQRAWRWGFEQNRQWAERHLPEAVEMFEVLPGVIRESNWLDELSSLLEAHGLEGVGRHFMSHEQVALVWGTKPLPSASASEPG
jgi:demethylmenaquinone methyltransferase/2-methoxy-6-polyprenyl-1,4-benzoquinol methylase